MEKLAWAMERANWNHSLLKIWTDETLYRFERFEPDYGCELDLFPNFSSEQIGADIATDAPGNGAGGPSLPYSSSQLYFSLDSDARHHAVVALADYCPSICLRRPEQKVKATG
ncbi:MAG: hypothetical protein RIK85_17045 [Marinobacter sp.]